MKKNKKWFRSLMVFLYFSTRLFLYGDQVYQFKAPNYSIKKSQEDIYEILMNGYFSYGVPGYPDLPSKIFRIAIPPDADLGSINIEYLELRRISLGNFNIPELPPMATWVDGMKVIGEKADVYRNNSYFPEKNIEFLGCSRMRKWKIVNIKYTPFQYNPVTKDLVFMPEAQVIIKYDRTITRLLSDLELTDRIMDRRAMEILLNYSEAEEWYLPQSQGPKPSQTYNYVIITSNTTKTSSTKLTDFNNYLTDKGYSVKVITETDFGSLIGQYPDNRAEKIREWLKSNYISMGIEYVLLIGDPSPYESGEGDVPMKMCWPRFNESSYRESPTDYFYADLTGNWDLDTDGYFGEYPDDQGTGGVDFANEIYVGRIPVYGGVSDLDSVLSKIISYGNPPDISWRRSVLLPMSFSDSTTDGAYLGETMKSNYLTPADYSSWTLYMQGGLCLEANSFFASAEELLDGVTRANWMNNPYGMVWWWGHGNQTGAYLGYDECGWGMIMSSPDTASLNDNFPSFVYQCSCSNGYPEVSNNLGTALLYNGAVATVSASRVSWYAVTSWYTGLKYYCDNASIGYYYGQELVSHEKQAAEALYDVKSDMGVNGGWWGGSSWMNLFDFNLYGSPETEIIVEYDLTISSTVGGTTNPPPETYNYPAGTEVNITATQEPDYRFSGWTGDVPAGEENENPITITMDSDKSIDANFARQYTLITEISVIGTGPGGTINPAPGNHIYDEGTDVDITATADSGYRFSGWTGDVPVGQENDNPITITINSDKSITANFIQRFTLTIAAETGGTTNPSPGSYTHDTGTIVSVRATANSGYQFDGWSGDASGTTNPINITLDSNKSITANFKAISSAPSDGDGDDGICFIATAAYGSPLHPHLDILRKFRDEYLLSNKLGRECIGLYYKYSPFVAYIIARHKALRLIALANLVPAVVFSYSMVHLGPIATGGIFLLILVFSTFLISSLQNKMNLEERFLNSEQKKINSQ